MLGKQQGVREEESLSIGASVENDSQNKSQAAVVIMESMI